MAIPNRGPTLLAVNTAFLVTAFIAILLRCYVRLVLVRAFGLDDWLMMAAMVFFTAYNISSSVGTHYGTGRHHRDLSTEGIRDARLCWWLCYLFYAIAMIASKLSIGYLLLRISVRKIHTWIIYAAMAVSVISGGTFFFVVMFQCYPVQFFWDRDIVNGVCVNNSVIAALAYTYSGFSIVSDFTFAIIPGFLIWNLQLKPKAKFALVPLIAMGCIASAAVIARLPYLSRFNSPDFLWETLDIAIWSTIEQGLAITAGSLAVIRPLFFLALERLGLATAVTQQRRSTYHMYGPRSGSSGIRKGGKLSSRSGDTNKVSTEALPHVSANPMSQDHEFAGMGKGSTWFSTSCSRPEARTVLGGEEDSESQHSLQNLSGRRSDEDAMHIMVSKSFVVTDEERRESLAQGPPSRSVEKSHV